MINNFQIYQQATMTGIGQPMNLPLWSIDLLSILVKFPYGVPSADKMELLALIEIVRH